MEDMSLVYNINLCRICQIPGNIDLVNTSDTTVKGSETCLDLLKYIFEDIIWVDDELISVACKTCLYKVIDIAEFKKICKETNCRRSLLNSNFIKHEDEVDKKNKNLLEENGLNEVNFEISRKRKIVEKKQKQIPRLKRARKKQDEVEEEEESGPSRNGDEIKIDNSDSDSEYEPVAKVKTRKVRHVNRKTTKIKKTLKYRNKSERTRALGIMCAICKISCISLAERDRHVYNQHDGVRTHICDICGKGYITKDDLSGHIKSVHADKEHFKFLCTECGAKFYKSSALQRHAEAHHSSSDVKFSCVICGNKYSTKGNLKTHMVTHTRNSDGHIKIANDEETNNTLDDDINNHDELDIMLNADSEDDSKSTKSEEEKIMSIIEGEKKRRGKPHTINMREQRPPKRRNKTDRTRTLGITCDVCKIPCISLAERDRHMYGQHNGVRSHICAICGRGYITKDDLSGHMKSVHANKQEFKFLCTECGAKFYKFSVLQKHTETRHKQLRKFTCTVCGRPFTTNGNLKSHMLTHTDIREYKCDLCPAEYKRKDVYLIHMTQKHDVGNYKCNRNLKEKNYACSMCEQRFNTRPRLLAHIRKHHTDVEPFCSSS